MAVEIERVIRNHFGARIVAQERVHYFGQALEALTRRDDDILISRRRVAVEEVVEMLDVLHAVCLRIEKVRNRARALGDGATHHDDGFALLEVLEATAVRPACAEWRVSTALPT